MGYGLQRRDPWSTLIRGYTVLVMLSCSVIEMAEAVLEFNPDNKLEDLKKEVILVFEELYRYLADRRIVLLTRLDKIREAYGRNNELIQAIDELKIAKASVKSNLLASMSEVYDGKIRGFENAKVDTENLEFVQFRCYSEKIRKEINEIDLFELSEEYVGRENPVLKACKRGRGNGEFVNPRGIVLDTARDEVYVCDNSNSRIQVLSTAGVYLRQFGRDHLTEPNAICLSQQQELFVTDEAKGCILKFGLTGEFLKQVGSRGTKTGRFNGITGLCCDAGLVYVCDTNLERIQVFDSDLNYTEQFGSGELRYPSDIQILSDTIYILSRTKNCIHCYNIDCTLQKKIELTGQEQLMTLAIFFSIDKKGNFLISDNSNHQIRIFSSEGVLQHILGTEHLQYLSGITLDNFGKIFCVCFSKEYCFTKF